MKLGGIDTFQSWGPQFWVRGGHERGLRGQRPALTGSHCPNIRTCREGLRAKCDDWHPLSRTEWSCLGGKVGTTAELGGIQNLEGEMHKGTGVPGSLSLRLLGQRASRPASNMIPILSKFISGY